MKYWLHPGAEQDLSVVAEYYTERGGGSLAQALLTDFERSMTLLSQHPLLGAPWFHSTRRLISHTQ